jgi:hypothetical protein
VRLSAMIGVCLGRTPHRISQQIWPPCVASTATEHLKALLACHCSLRGIGQSRADDDRPLIYLARISF